MKYVSILFLILVLAACAKFEHSELELNPACELCDWADSREGIYSGLQYSETASGTSSGDSIVFTISHVFLNQNAYDDSTRMYFQVHEEWLSTGATYDWKCSATDSSGVLDGARWNSFVLRADSIKADHSWTAFQTFNYHHYGVFYR
jgi:hypothetical protein